MRSSTSRPAVLARVLDRVDDLARQPLAPQLVVELELERHRVRALALELVAVERLHRELQVVRAEVVVVAVDADADARARAHRRGDVRGVERLDRGGDLRHQLAEARARASGSSA